MRLLLDECVPKRLKGELRGHEVKTVQDMGWAGIKNGALLKLADVRRVHRSGRNRGRRASPRALFQRSVALTFDAREPQEQCPTWDEGHTMRIGWAR